MSDELKIKIDSSDVEKSLDRAERKLHKTIETVDELNRRFREKIPKKKLEIDLSKTERAKVTKLKNDIKAIPKLTNIKLKLDVDVDKDTAKKLPKNQTIKVKVDVDKNELNKISGIQKTLERLNKQAQEQNKISKQFDNEAAIKKYAGTSDVHVSTKRLNMIKDENRAYRQQATAISGINRLLSQQGRIKNQINKSSIGFFNQPKQTKSVQQPTRQEAGFEKKLEPKKQEFDPGRFDSEFKFKTRKEAQQAAQQAVKKEIDADRLEDRLKSKIKKDIKTQQNQIPFAERQQAQVQHPMSKKLEKSLSNLNETLKTSRLLKSESEATKPYKEKLHKYPQQLQQPLRNKFTEDFFKDFKKIIDNSKTFEDSEKTPFTDQQNKNIAQTRSAGHQELRNIKRDFDKYSDGKGDGAFSKSLKDRMGAYDKYVDYMAGSSGKIAKSIKQINKYRAKELDLIDKAVVKEKEAGGLQFKHQEDKYRKEQKGFIDEALQYPQKHLDDSILAHKALKDGFAEQRNNLGREIKYHNGFINRLEQNQKKISDLYKDNYREPIEKGVSTKPKANETRQDFQKGETELKALKASRKILTDKIRLQKKYTNLVKKHGVEQNRIKHIDQEHSDLLKSMGGDYQRAHTSLYDNGDKKGISFGIGNIPPVRHNRGFKRGGGGGDDVIQQLPQNKLLGRFAQFGMMASGLAATIFVTQMIGAQLYNLMEIIINWENAILGVIDSIKLSSSEMEKLPDTIREYSRNLGINQVKTAAAFEASMEYNTGSSQKDVQGMYALNYSDNVKDYEQAALITLLSQSNATIAGMSEQYSTKYNRYSGNGQDGRSADFGYEWDSLKSAAGEGLIEIWTKEDTNYGERIKKTMKDITSWMNQNRATIGDWADSFVGAMKLILKWTKVTLPAVGAFLAAFATWHGGKMFLMILKNISTTLRTAWASVVGMGSAMGALTTGARILSTAFTALWPAVAAAATITGIFKLTMAIRDARKEVKYFNELKTQTSETLAKLTHAELDQKIYADKAKLKVFETRLEALQDQKKLLEAQPEMTMQESSNKYQSMHESVNIGGHEIEMITDSQYQYGNPISNRALPNIEKRIKELEEQKKLIAKALLKKESLEGQKYMPNWEATDLIPEWSDFLGILEKVNEQFTFMPSVLEDIKNKQIEMEFTKNLETAKYYEDGYGTVALQKEIKTFNLGLQKDPKAQAAYDKELMIADDKARGFDTYEKKMFKLQAVAKTIRDEFKIVGIAIDKIGPSPALINRFRELRSTISVVDKEFQGLSTQKTQSDLEKLTASIRKLNDEIENLGKGTLEKKLNMIELAIGKGENKDKNIELYNKTAELARGKYNQSFQKRNGVDPYITKQIADRNSAYTMMDAQGNKVNLPKDAAYDASKAYQESQLEKNRIARELATAKQSSGSWKLQNKLNLEEEIRKINLEYEMSMARNKANEVNKANEAIKDNKVYAKLPASRPVMEPTILKPEMATKTGEIIKVLDGDTYRVQWEDLTTSIVRAIGLNSAEKDTPEGMAATRQAQEDLLGKTFQFESTLGEGAVGKYLRELYDIILSTGQTYTQKAISEGHGVAADYGRSTYRSKSNQEAEAFATRTRQTEHLLKEDPERVREKNITEAILRSELNEKLMKLNGRWKEQEAVVSQLQLGGEKYNNYLKKKIILEAQLAKIGETPKEIKRQTALPVAMVDLNNMIKDRNRIAQEEDQTFGESPNVKIANALIKKYIDNTILKIFRTFDNFDVYTDKQLTTAANQAYGANIPDPTKPETIAKNLSDAERFDSTFNRGFSDEQFKARKAVVASNVKILESREEDPTDYKRDANFQILQDQMAQTKTAWEDYYSSTGNMMREHYENEARIIENSYQNNIQINSGISTSMAELIKQEQLYQLTLKNRKNLSTMDDILFGYENGLQRLQGEFQTTGQIIESTMVSGVDKLSDSLHNVVMGTTSLKEAFREMAYSVLDDMAKMLMKQIVLQTLMGTGFASGKSNEKGGLVGLAGGAISSMFSSDQSAQPATQPAYDYNPDFSWDTSPSWNTGLDYESGNSNGFGFGESGGGISSVELGAEAFSPLEASAQTGLTKVFSNIGNMFNEGGIFGGMIGGIQSGFSLLFSGIQSMINSLNSGSSGGSSGGGGLGGLVGIVVGGVMSYFGGGSAGGGMSNASGWAQGGVLTGISSYRNQIVSEPTFVASTNSISRYATGGALFGEAGPEAIMPLTRMPSGDLGVKMQNSNSEESSSSNSDTAETPAPAINVVNVLDPGIVQDFLDTSDGERAVINMIQRNSGAINQVLQIGG